MQIHSNLMPIRTGAKVLICYRSCQTVLRVQLQIRSTSAHAPMAKPAYNQQIPRCLKAYCSILSPVARFWGSICRIYFISLFIKWRCSLSVCSMCRIVFQLGLQSQLNTTEIKCGIELSYKDTDSPILEGKQKQKQQF